MGEDTVVSLEWIDRNERFLRPRKKMAAYRRSQRWRRVPNDVVIPLASWLTFPITVAVLAML